MHNAVNDMIEKYKCVTPDDYRNALKEIIQEIALLGLYRGNFFDKAAFYGGTALRIFYGLDRFSEDMDFSLYESNVEFDVFPYCRFIQDELNSFGFEVEVTKKRKASKSNIESAFIKAGTLIHFVKIGFGDFAAPEVPSNEVLKIKLEIDTAPPGKAEYEVKYQLNPIPYHVRMFTLPCLFAGKTHALLCREWGGGRIKGRDLYDYIWYLSRQIPLNIGHLEERMKQTNHLPAGETLGPDKLQDLLFQKFASIDYKQAKDDILPFLKDPIKINIWSESFFRTVTKEKFSQLLPGEKNNNINKDNPFYK